MNKKSTWPKDKKTKNDKRPLPDPDDNLGKAAYEAGGLLLRVNLKSTLGANGGCGAPTHVEGTNDGMMPCGSLLTMLGRTEPYYCVACLEKMATPEIKMQPCHGCKHDPSVTGFHNLCSHPHENRLFMENVPIDKNGFPYCYRSVDDPRTDYIPGLIILTISKHMNGAQNGDKR